jgi:hypothetical protein
MLRGPRLQVFDLLKESAGQQSGFARQLGRGPLQGPDALVRFAQQLVTAEVADGGDGQPAGKEKRRPGCADLRRKRPGSISRRSDSQLVADRIEPPIRQAAHSPAHFTPHRRSGLIRSDWSVLGGMIAPAALPYRSVLDAGRRRGI